ncbi:N-acetyltransferase [Oleomonas cavernae]|uniref:N-acetyltransferase n=1 Tax=Oleomonas cavernae TaxID=2320859 RepID=A0A418WBM4_9PROT|nr:GNAT family N-acetyltransferase [Oleomonas cavernae]RJF87443.1 N-acetyltransferase [Oleomonas cavernae]
MTLSAPEVLGSGHAVTGFNSGVASLDDWLKRRALANQASGATRTYVTCADGRVVGYYALASGSVNVTAAPGRFRRNMPDPIPIVLLARLAVDQSCRGQGLGRALFRDAALRVINAADAIGIRGIVVHAISEEAKAFYIALGFDPSPLEPMTLLITLGDLMASAQR